VVAMAGDNVIRLAEPPVPARLVSFDPSEPETVVDLGLATSWFPSFDGTGVWRVLGRRRDAMSKRRAGIFEATPYGLDGRQGGPTLRLGVGQRPVAATAAGLAVEVPIPERPYPPHVSGPQTLIGGVVVDLVHFDGTTGTVVAVISEYTLVRVAAAHGAALVGNSDPNMKVRPTEIVNLDGGAVHPDEAAQPELALPPMAQPRDHGGVAHQVEEPRRLLVMPLEGNGMELSSNLVPVPRPRGGEGWRERQDWIWADTTLLYPEAVEGGVEIAAWDSSSPRPRRFPPGLPPESYPIGGVF
jgi:hypothetical protein